MQKEIRRSVKTHSRPLAIQRGIRMYIRKQSISKGLRSGGRIAERSKREINAMLDMWLMDALDDDERERVNSAPRLDADVISKLVFKGLNLSHPKKS